MSSFWLLCLTHIHNEFGGVELYLLLFIYLFIFFFFFSSSFFFFKRSHGWNLGQHRLPGGKHNVYDHSTRIPFVARGPGIKPGTYLDAPASNVDVAPTLLTLAGAPELAANMDGKSVASLLIQEEETEAIDEAIENEGEESVVSVEGAEEKVRGSDHGDNFLATKTDPPASTTDALPKATRKALEAERLALAARGGWRTHHPIEFAALSNHTWFGHLIDDLVSNTYRALRFVGDPEYGDLLYAEFTSVDDWHYQKPVHYELFNMTEDPHQLVNLYSRSPQYLKDRLQARLVQQWGCQGASCL